MISEHTNEDEEMSKCKSAVHRVKKMENDVDVALSKGKNEVTLLVLAAIFY